MIFSVIITTLKGEILFSRYYVTTLDLDSILSWEKTLFHLTSSSWEDAKQAQQLAVTEFNQQYDQSELQHWRDNREQFIVYQAADEVLIFLCGQGDDNEISR